MKIFHGQQTLFTIRTTGQWMISITKAVAKHRDAPSCETKKFLPGGMLWFSLGQIFGVVISEVVQLIVELL